MVWQDLTSTELMFFIAVAIDAGPYQLEDRTEQTVTEGAWAVPLKMFHCEDLSTLAKLSILAPAAAP